MKLASVLRDQEDASDSVGSTSFKIRRDFWPGMVLEHAPYLIWQHAAK